MFDNTKAKVFWIVVGLSAAALALTALWAVFSGYLNQVPSRAPSVPSSSTTSIIVEQLNHLIDRYSQVV